MPRNGRQMTKIVQPAFAQPLVSCRLNRSPKTMNSIQKNRIQAKKTNIDHMTSPNV